MAVVLSVYKTQTLLLRVIRWWELFKEECDVTHHTDIPEFLDAEREEAKLGLLDETEKEMVESLTSRHWDSVAREWELEAVAGG